ncbi:MAG: metallophosphoesterase family protein [Christensenellales bacterium]
MKIVHTSDWHLGKRLAGKNRLNEQREVLSELAGLVRSVGADVLLIAGDVFDTFVPPAEAEELFYSAMLEISRFAVPVAIAGNHDDAQRLSAPDGLARACGILLLGGNQSALRFSGNYGGKPTDIETGDGFARITRGGETLNLAYLEYPSAAKLAELAGEKNYADFVSDEAERRCGCFTKDGINVFMSHLFVIGSEGQLSDERELGGSKLLPLSALPVGKSLYTALGHIHKPFTVSESGAAYYSGSIMQLSFDDVSAKRVLLIETDGKNISVTSEPLSKGRRLARIKVGSEQEAIAALDGNADKYVMLDYESAIPLSGRAVSDFRKRECYCGINVIPVRGEKTPETQARRGKSDGQLFEMFYAEKCGGKKPDDSLTEMFLKAVNGEEF